MSSFDVIGYTYAADNYCVDCMTDIATDRVFELDSERVYVHTRAALEVWARLAGITDVTDERSYDCGDYPKVIFPFMVDEEPEHCGRCGKEIV